MNNKNHNYSNAFNGKGFKWVVSLLECEFSSFLMDKKIISVRMGSSMRKFKKVKTNLQVTTDDRVNYFFIKK